MEYFLFPLSQKPEFSRGIQGVQFVNPQIVPQRTLGPRAGLFHHDTYINVVSGGHALRKLTGEWGIMHKNPSCWFGFRHTNILPPWF
jgi:hypothetical protein